ncbi:MAG: potassium channel family protein [Bacteroidia bacterium]|nr:potassium channel family protein [Bacteroidia bacterium]
MSENSLYERLYSHRFELFFVSQLSILFGSLVVPLEIHINYLSPILFLFNLLCGVLLISKNRKLFRIFVVLFGMGILVTGGNPLLGPKFFEETKFTEFSIYFIFYFIVTIQIIKQVWNTVEVDKNVIMGLMCGYISLGLLAFFLFFSIELANPGSFKGINMYNESGMAKADSLLYYSYITLLTIGYGEIFPISPVAQKAAILIGLVGQFYFVIITAVVVEKYIRHIHENKEE